MPRKLSKEELEDIAFLPAERGVVFANLPQLFELFGAIAARSFGEAILELLVPSENGEEGDYEWAVVESLQAVVDKPSHLRPVN